MNLSSLNPDSATAVVWKCPICNSDVAKVIILRGGDGPLKVRPLWMALRPL
jgi:hypothetical protein